MFGYKIKIIKSDDVVLSKDEYTRLTRDSETLKRVLNRMIEVMKKRKSK